MIKRLALCALLVLGAGYGAQSHFDRPPTGFLEADDVLGDMVRNRSSGDLSRDMRLAAAVSLSAPHNVTREVRVSDHSVVFLVVRYLNGSIASGTGTVIRGSDDVARVLTASHVIESPDAIDRIIAFTGDGRAAALLDPVVIGNEGANPMSLHPRDVERDVAVLEASAFASDSVEIRWHNRGVRISPIQSDHIMAVTFGQDNTIANTGLSGGSVRLANGDVVGLMNYVFYPQDPHPVPASAFVDRARFLLMAEGDTLGIGDALEILTVNPPESASYMGGMGLATPIVDPDVLEALKAGPVRSDDTLPPFRAIITGFPKNEMRSGEVVATPLSGYSLAPDHMP